MTTDPHVILPETAPATFPPPAALEELRLLREEMDALRADLAAFRIEWAARGVAGGNGNGNGMGVGPHASPIASGSSSPRVTPYTVAEFAALVRRSKRYIASCCRANEIRALPGKPYLIPAGELTHFLDTRGESKRRLRAA